MAVFGSHLAEQGALRLDREPTGNRVQTSGPSDVFPTRDGHVLTHVVGNGLFKRCAELLGRPDWVGATDLDSDQGRGDARDALCDAMADWCAQRTTEAALEELQAAGIPAGPVLNLQEAVDLPQAAALGLFKAIGFPGWDGEAPVVDLPLRFSGGEAGIRSAPPALGADSEAILEDLGFDQKTIRSLLD
jgi:crotonobetainyl-CoA:carnitine CoA-transferase CaiB-like acyl-CoA transferase